MNDFSLTNNINFLKEQCLTNRLITLRYGFGILEASNRTNESAVFHNFSPLLSQNGDTSTHWSALQIRPKCYICMQNDILCFYR